MPRAKVPKKQPIEVHPFELDGEEWEAEVWENRADEGTRGAHKLRLRDDVFNIALPLVDERLNSNSPTEKQTYERLLDGRLKRVEFAKIIRRIAKANKLVIGKTLSEEIVDDIKKHYQACANALAAIEAEQKDFPPEP